MADNEQNSAQEKTEQPTQRRLDKAREEVLKKYKGEE